MTAARKLERARGEAAAGKNKAALRSAWDAVQAAMAVQDETVVRDVELLARDIVTASEGSVQADAAKLAAYCSALLDGVGGGVQAPSLIDRMFSRRRQPDRTKRCPDCAETIKEDAKACRFCGFRYAGPPA